MNMITITISVDGEPQQITLDRSVFFIHGYLKKQENGTYLMLQLAGDLMELGPLDNISEGRRALAMIAAPSRPWKQIGILAAAMVAVVLVGLVGYRSGVHVSEVDANFYEDMQAATSPRMAAAQLPLKSDIDPNSRQEITQQALKMAMEQMSHESKEVISRPDNGFHFEEPGNYPPTVSTESVGKPSKSWMR